MFGNPSWSLLSGAEAAQTNKRVLTCIGMNVFLYRHQHFIKTCLGGIIHLHIDLKQKILQGGCSSHTAQTSEYKYRCKINIPSSNHDLAFNVLRENLKMNTEAQS